jgi:hypothetical protein
MIFYIKRTRVVVLSGLATIDDRDAKFIGLVNDKNITHLSKMLNEIIYLQVQFLMLEYKKKICSTLKWAFLFITKQEHSRGSSTFFQGIYSALFLSSVFGSVQNYILEL